MYSIKELKSNCQPTLKFHNFSCLTGILVTLIGCASAPQIQAKPSITEYPTLERPVVGCAADERPFDCDRRAILALQGEFQVTFNFYETVILKPGYTRKGPKHSGAFEKVVLIEDNGKKLSFQHLLVNSSGEVIKHWRQDWVYESLKNWSYVGDQRFEQQTKTPEEIAGTWTQLVYEVSDAPRYTGTGKWNHKYGVSTWTSDRTWRPLPRREYTTRDDYQLINAENRHTITPQGWTHEQDNTKVIRTSDQKDTVLVREFGFNEYRRISGYDFSDAMGYWQATAPFWAAVRAHWSDVLAKDSTVLVFPTGDNQLIDGLFKLAEDYKQQPDLRTHQSKLDALFKRFVKTESKTSK
ncbi:hypothetical protein SAMN05428978_11183 [Nitrosomonas sp. Nm34]|nr:hypothetical protein SAMN05428978_11183 [Nitrosomonas sp. Nm34]